MQRVLLAAVAVGLLASAPAPSAAAPGEHAPGEHAPVIGLHVPWAIGGPRIDPGPVLTERQPEWPAFPVRAVRLWDTRTAWLNLEPARDAYDWSTLDRNVAQARAHGTTDITLVLWGTPRWAAASESPDDAAWLGPGSAAPPKDEAEWAQFVADAATRYRGVITAYEVGNEVTERAFWRGTDDELARLVAVAEAAIREADPDARVIAPSVACTMASGAEAAGAAGIWRALRRHGVRVDALAAHWYPAAGTPPASLPGTLRRLRALAEAAGWGRTPLWITEAGFRFPDATPAQATSLMRRTAAVLHRASAATATTRFYWYAWTDARIGDMMPLPRDADPARLRRAAPAAHPR